MVGTWGSQDNILNTHFRLFGSEADFLAANDPKYYTSSTAAGNPWTFCNYDDTNIAFPRDCGPSGPQGWQWNGLTRAGSQNVYTYSVLDAGGLVTEYSWQCCLVTSA